jgi:hypothetical protein
MQADIGYLRIYNFRITWNSITTKMTQNVWITFQKPGAIDKLIRDVHDNKQNDNVTDNLYLPVNLCTHFNIFKPQN